MPQDVCRGRDPEKGITLSETDTGIQHLPLDRLFPHPDNPRLQLREDVLDRLAAEIQRDRFRPEHAVLVRPLDGGWQIVSGHHRVEAAGRAGLSEIPAWVREMDDDEAFMQLVLGNTQGELSPLEIGMHALKAVPLSEGGRGKRGGITGYAERLGTAQGTISKWRAAAEVAETHSGGMGFGLSDKVGHLYEISKAPREVWEPLVESLLGREWSVADTAHYVKSVREFAIPGEWAWWLPLTTVVERFLQTREFAPATVSRLVAAARQVADWIDASAVDKDQAHGEFRAWLNREGESAWQPRAVAGYLQRLIASQFVVEGWHHGDWRGHLDKLDDGSVTLLLTDPPYGMNYQSDYRLDRRIERKHERIASDDLDAPAEVTEMLQAFHGKLAGDAHVLLFCGWAGEPEMREAVTKAGYTLRGSLVWDKQATGMGDPTTTFAPAHERILHAVKGSPPLYQRAADLLRHSRCDSSRHPTEKPVGLLRELIEATTVEGQVVADPFGGVASTPAAAKASGRRWFGCEIEEKYWQAGEERLLS